MTRNEVIEKLVETGAIVFISNDCYITNDGISEVDFFACNEWLNITVNNVVLHFHLSDVNDITRYFNDLVIETAGAKQCTYITLVR